MMTRLKLNINGGIHEVEVDSNETLLEVLRDRIELTGTKRGCDIGACGACTVMVEGEPTLSCMTLAVRCGDRRITTIEGLAVNGRLHPLQEAAINHGAVQCGYCTPGWLMSAYALLEDNPLPTRDEVRAAIAGNFCRCTGYQKIIDSILAAAAAYDPDDLRE